MRSSGRPEGVTAHRAVAYWIAEQFPPAASRKPAGPGVQGHVYPAIRSQEGGEILGRVRDDGSVG